MDTAEKVCAALAEKFPGETVKPETTFQELKLDSLDIMDTVMTLEEKFGVTIELNERMESVGDLIKKIEALIA